jgi:hypothetical protein
MGDNDRRLIEDYLPIEAISVEASREKSVRKGHISTLHLWWARRPLVACRAAVYGALVPALRFVPEGASDEESEAKGRENAEDFVTRLCKDPGDPMVIAEAQKHILEAHAERLTKETGRPVTVADIQEGRARVMKSCPGACSSLIPDLLRIWACRRLVSAVIVLTRRASLRTISRRHAHGIAPRLRGWFRRSVSRPWPQGSGPTR